MGVISFIRYAFMSLKGVTVISDDHSPESNARHRCDEICDIKSLSHGLPIKRKNYVTQLQHILEC